MVKKTKSRRSGRPRLSEAQLEAYRQRRALLAEGAARDAGPTAAGAEPAAVHATSWGRVDEEYATIRSDLIRLLVITAFLFAILAALTFVLN